MNARVRAVCFPHDDHTFHAQVDELIRSDEGEPLQAAVEATLRETYPLAVVSARHAFAGLDGICTWYVYRDGSLVRRGSDVEA